MQICESVEGHWDHSNGRVEFHGARSKWNHGIGQTQVLVGKSLDVSHHVGLRELHRELVLLQVFSLSSNLFWNLLVDLVVVLLKIKLTVFGVVLVLLERIENVDQLIQIIKTCKLVK
jgi:hypothetical protein